MTNKKIITTVSFSLIGVYAIIFLYQRYNRKKSDESVDSYEEALKKLEDAKKSKSLLYNEPNIQLVEDATPSYPEENYVMAMQSEPNLPEENYVMQSNPEFDIDAITGFLKNI